MLVHVLVDGNKLAQDTHGADFCRSVRQSINTLTLASTWYSKYVLFQPILSSESELDSHSTLSGKYIFSLFGDLAVCASYSFCNSLEFHKTQSRWTEHLVSQVIHIFSTCSLAPMHEFFPLPFPLLFHCNFHNRKLDVQHTRSIAVGRELNNFKTKMKNIETRVAESPMLSWRNSKTKWYNCLNMLGLGVAAARRHSFQWSFVLSRRVPLSSPPTHARPLDDLLEQQNENHQQIGSHERNGVDEATAKRRAKERQKIEEKKNQNSFFVGGEHQHRRRRTIALHCAAV